MADEQQQHDPPVYKFLSPKTQGFLRASNKQREEQAKAAEDTNMSTEQT
jgi:nucleoside-diphosphate kinase